jgi:ATP-dependent DNA helicase DinG
MGVLVSTSSIALQKAVYTETIPDVSKILVERGVIRKPLTAALRKGKEHYVCEYNLAEYLSFERDCATRNEPERLAFDGSVIDLAEVDALPAQVKSKISVPQRCYKSCRFAADCRYRAFRDEARNTGYDFVICNHQLLLADVKLRAEEAGSVLPPFQILILDEAHKVLPAARSLYASELAADAIPAVTKALIELNFVPAGSAANDSWKVIRDRARFLSGKLYEVNKRLFSRRGAGAECDRIIRNIRDVADLLVKCLSVSRELEVERDEQLKHSLTWELRRISKAVNELFDSGGVIRWFVAEGETQTAVGGIPKRLNDLLYDDLWSRGIPGMLTSGTLSVGGDFTALKQSLGLARKNVRLSEVMHDSPFNYKEKPMSPAYKG